MERTKLLITCAGPAASHVREAGAGESRDRAGGGGGKEQGGAPPHQGPAGQATAGRHPRFLVQILAARCLLMRCQAT